MSKKRAESRARYYLRSQAQKRGWKVGHPSKGGEILEEQEIIDHFPDIGLGLERPDFLRKRLISAGVKTTGNFRGVLDLENRN